MVVILHSQWIVRGLVCAKLLFIGRDNRHAMKRMPIGLSNSRRSDASSSECIVFTNRKPHIARTHIDITTPAVGLHASFFSVSGNREHQVILTRRDGGHLHTTDHTVLHNRCLQCHHAIAAQKKLHS